jgi:hypothetical protein
LFGKKKVMKKRRRSNKRINGKVILCNQGQVAEFEYDLVHTFEIFGLPFDFLFSSLFSLSMSIHVKSLAVERFYSSYGALVWCFPLSHDPHVLCYTTTD